MSTGNPYGFFDDTRDTGATSVGDQSRRGHWMESVRGGNQTEIAPGITGDGHQKIVRSADGKLVIYNYGTINWKRGDCGGVDYRDGNRNHDFRDHIPYARDQRNRNPQTYSVGGDEDYNFGEAQYAQWERNFLQNMNQGNLNQRQFSERTYPQQYYGPQQPGYGPQAFFQPRPNFNPNQNFMPGGVQALNMIARLGMIYALSRGNGNGLLALGLAGNGGYYGQNNYLYGGNNNYLYGGNSNYLYGGNNNGAYYAGGYVPSTFNNFQNGTQFVPNNAYAWQQATRASMIYGGRPYANYPPGYYDNGSAS